MSGTPDREPLGLSSRIVAKFLQGPLPVMVIVLSLLAGAAALLLTPREEEPQIVVPLADVLVSAPGLSAEQVERQKKDFIRLGVLGEVELPDRPESRPAVPTRPGIPSGSPGRVARRSPSARGHPLPAPPRRAARRRRRRRT